MTDFYGSSDELSVSITARISSSDCPVTMYHGVNHEEELQYAVLPRQLLRHRCSACRFINTYRRLI